MDNNVLLVLVGASGTGKSSLMKELRKKYGAPILCSYTTRAKRPGEVDGDDYKFVSIDEMNKLDLLERIEYAGNVYGTPRALFDDALRDHAVSMIAMNIDGARLLKEEYGDSVSLILLTMPDDVRKALLEKRDGKEAAAKRLAGEDAPATAADADFDFVLPNNGKQWSKIRKIIEAAYFDN